MIDKKKVQEQKQKYLATQQEIVDIQAGIDGIHNTFKALRKAHGATCKCFGDGYIPADKCETVEDYCRIMGIDINTVVTSPEEYVSLLKKLQTDVSWQKTVKENGFACANPQNCIDSWKRYNEDPKVLKLMEEMKSLGKEWEGISGVSLYTPTEEEVERVLKSHNEWLASPSKGEQADFSDMNLCYKNYTKGIFENKDLRHANFSNAHIEISFTGSDLSDSCFEGADAGSSSFQYAKLCRANFTNVKTSSGANFTYSDRTGIIK